MSPVRGDMPYIPFCFANISFGNGPSFISQINITGVGHGDLLFLPQILHGDAHAGLLEIQFVGHIHGTNYRESFTQN